MIEYMEGENQVYAFAWNESKFIIRLHDDGLSQAYLRLDTHQLERFKRNLDHAINKFVESQEKK